MDIQTRRNLVLEDKFDFKILTFRSKRWSYGIGKWKRGRTGDLDFRVDGAGKLYEVCPEKVEPLII